MPSDVGLVTLSEFLYFWGCIFIVMTTLIGIFKHEKNENIERSEDEYENIKRAYHMLWKTINLSNIKTMSLILLTAKVCHIHKF